MSGFDPKVPGVSYLETPFIRRRKNTCAMVIAPIPFALAGGPSQDPEIRSVEGGRPDITPLGSASE